MADSIDLQPIAHQMGISLAQVKAVVKLLDTGNTIPFIARYRKEMTQGLDEIQLRAVEDGVTLARELESRKQTVLKSIEQQGLLDEALRAQIERCQDRNTLEDLYLPFKPKRRTRATIARDRGLQPLADLLLAQEPLRQERTELLRQYVAPDREVPDPQAALEGACDIVAETWAEQPDARQWLREQAHQAGSIHARAKRGQTVDGTKFELYRDHTEPIRRLPSHRLLAIRRGEAEGLLRVALKLDDDFVIRKLRQRWVTRDDFEFRRELREVAEDAYQRLLLPATESAIFNELKERADEEAISVFAKNIRELLLAPPAGPKVTLGIDPGFRTGCKVAVVDGTGKYLESAAIFPTPPKSDEAGAERVLLALIKKYDAQLIAIGNGTASRETEAFVDGLIQRHSLDLLKVMVSESGASIYSASELAASEYPNLDVTVRGAISIAHRLQDPLAELVKIDPKSIGVGQYQHDVNQSQLKRCLEREVESCVNSVGVDLNLASASLLSHVAGIGPKLAQRIVEHRDRNGSFRSRRQLCDVPKLGNKAFVQSAGFLRIRDGKHPLDNSAVHPEAYYVVDRMAKDLNCSAQQLVGNASFAAKLDAARFVDEKFGVPTVQDILAELAKPGRDPRSEFRVAKFADGVNQLSDVRPGMVLEGVVTNVTRFGAFVDIGVHQDGLVHISQLADHFVADPNDEVSVGDIVKVKVQEVDEARKRISLTRKF